MTEYDNTLFKSSYYYGKTLHQMFINHGFGGHKSFSFVMRRGSSTYVHNLTVDESLPVLKHMISRLSSEERAKLILELSNLEKVI